MSFWRMITYPFRPGARRPLATRQPMRDAREDVSVPLGMEALDLKAVASVNRRNDALERVNVISAADGRGTHQTAVHVQAMPDDETYAARYHRVFKQKGAD